ncbi:EamA family transporter [Haloplanus aerogenes]|uniref:Multidrug transporter n=1 Tax=Haloplanus aerogenes TaxID=660522 RepID=A0A3M0D9U6_9EURY|nr:EamA family transporter [Haloplanus aerogenes]AZH26145.1 multidrug transporter [Haloplanus aerogenes]RMB18402.1 transporter family protein [Haloplanus aerogenes]
MGYLQWALVALVAYSAVAPLVGFATTGDPKIPSFVAALITNGLLLVATIGVVLYEGHSVTTYLSHPKAPYLYLAGLFLAVGILAYYRALSLGPVSAVVPIFGTFLVVSSVVGIVFLSESLTLRKVAGIACAMLGIYLVSV